MARTPPKEHQFKAGRSGNPLGGKLHNQDIRKLKRLTQAEVAELVQVITQNTYSTITQVAEDPEASVLKVWMARVVIRAMKEGDMSVLNSLLPWGVGHLSTKTETKHTHLIDEANRIASLTYEEARDEAVQIIELADSEHKAIKENA